MINVNDTYTIVIYEILAEKGFEIIKAFEDRDISIEISEIAGDVKYNGTCTMTIKNIHEITITPFMMWFLHHVDHRDYYKVVII